MTEEEKLARKMRFSVLKSKRGNIYINKYEQKVDMNLTLKLHVLLLTKTMRDTLEEIAVYE